MKPLLFACVSLFIVGCAAVPVSIKFPEVPKELQEPCPVLTQVSPQDHSLSNLLTVVTHNYAQYYECKNRADGWSQWYQEQKKIYESISK